MKKILIISYLFEPMSSIGAVRPSKLAKYLTMSGYTVDVFTASEGKCEGFLQNKGYRVIYDIVDSPENVTAREREQQSNRTLKIGSNSILIHEIKLAYRQMRIIKQGIQFRGKLKDAIKRNRIDISQYDFVFTTFGPVASLLCGLIVKKENPRIRWINDFRDPMVSDIMPKLVAPYYRLLQATSIKNCDVVTTVSNGYKKRIATGKYYNKCIVIPNGYDDDDIVLDKTTEEDTKFSFAYVGALYEGKRDLSSFFQQLSALVETGEIDRKNLVFHYAGNDYDVLRTQAKRSHMEDIIINHGRVTRSESLKIQRKARVLVLVTWNDKGEEGVFPGKFIEYMQMKKPIYAIVNGKVSGSEVSEVIEKYHLGTSYEDANLKSHKQAQEWLQSLANEYRTTGQTTFMGDTDQVDKRYNWKNIIKQFEKIMM